MYFNSAIAGVIDDKLLFLRSNHTRAGHCAVRASGIALNLLPSK